MRRPRSGFKIEPCTLTLSPRGAHRRARPQKARPGRGRAGGLWREATVEELNCKLQ